VTLRLHAGNAYTGPMRTAGQGANGGRGSISTTNIPSSLPSARKRPSSEGFPLPALRLVLIWIGSVHERVRVQVTTSNHDSVSPLLETLISSLACAREGCQRKSNNPASAHGVATGAYVVPSSRIREGEPPWRFSIRSSV
jgi:hypothetical protein